MDDFERIYAEYYDQVYGYCLRLTHDPHLAEEVTQEAFFKALKAIGSFHGECRLQRVAVPDRQEHLLLPCTRNAAAPRPRPAGRGDWPDPADLEERLGDKDDRPADPPGAPPAARPLPGGLLAAGLWGAELRPDCRPVRKDRELGPGHLPPGENEAEGGIGMKVTCKVIQDLLPLYRGRRAPPPTPPPWWRST